MLLQVSYLVVYLSWEHDETYESSLQGVNESGWPTLIALLNKKITCIFVFISWPGPNTY